MKKCFSAVAILISTILVAFTLAACKNKQSVQSTTNNTADHISNVSHESANKINTFTEKTSKNIKKLSTEASKKINQIDINNLGNGNN
ncbi:MAG: hypothetical protein GY756_07150 [bacterium]|nr:hypothetical protein [bacterium]